MSNSEKIEDWMHYKFSAGQPFLSGFTFINDTQIRCSDCLQIMEAGIIVAMNHKCIEDDKNRKKSANI
jgi:hypothetical protein